MKKLFAWILFFALIGGSFASLRYLIERPEIQNTFTNVKKGVDQTLGQLEEKEQPETKDIVLKDKKELQKDSFYNEYNEVWAMTHEGYKNFTLEMPNQDGGYIAGEGRTLFSTVIGTSTLTEVKAQYGEPLGYIQKDNTRYTMNEKSADEFLMYDLDGYYVTFFFDIHNDNKLRAIQYINKKVEQQKPGFYATPSNDLRDGFEREMIELMNQSRVEAGLEPLKFDKGLIEQARKHSQDMAEKNYFSHTGSDGSSPEKRMKAAGYLTEQYYAENLAYGQYSSIFAHEGLMNSLGHRKNILSKELEYAGVGVAFDDSNRPYYTINFYTPF